MTAIARSSGVSIGRDALGNVFVTGDGNTLDVKLTVVVADSRLQDRAAAGVAAADNPYRGLDAFREADSAVFFGREDLIARLWTRLHGLHHGGALRLLPILGASGSGKSSLVRAGLLPELVRQPMDGMRSPTVLVLRPGANPLQRLADVLARIAAAPDIAASCMDPSPAAVDAVHRAARAGRDAGDRVVLFVDQLEELFTECPSEAARGAFLAKLAYAAAQPDGLVSVIFAMSNDFAGSLRTYDGFALAVREQRFMVSPLSRAQLLDAIERPARVLGHPWPAGLVESLALQCEGRAGSLPLLQFALKRLWPEHVAGRLAESRWSSRLIEDFVVQAADALFDDTGAPAARAASQRIIRRAFLAMVQLGEGAADTRRVARLSEIVARGETDEQVREVLAPFLAPEARLVTASELDGEPTYELAHEALIGSWDRLRAWLGTGVRGVGAEAIRGELRLRRRLGQAAAAWQADRDAVLRPPELAPAAALRDRAPDELTALETGLVAASLAAWNRSVGWRRRAVRVIGAMSVVLAVFSVAVSVLGLIAWRRTRETERLLAASQRTLGMAHLERGRALVLDDHPMQALPYLVAARGEGVDGPVIDLLFSEAVRDLPLVTIAGHGSWVATAAFSPDGTRVVTASRDGTARIWDAATGEPVTAPLTHGSDVVSAAWSPDGTRVVTASDDKTARVWNARTGAQLFQVAHNDSVETAVFSADGTRVVTASTDGTARIWDATTGSAPAIALLAHGQPVWDAAISADGRRVVTASADQTARLWDATTGRPLIPALAHPDQVMFAVFSPDGARVATASADRVRVWDAATGALQATLAHGGEVKRVVFSPDGARLATASRDGTAQIWDAVSWQRSAGPLAHRGAVAAVVFSPDGTRVATASDDGTARVWDAATGAPLTGPLEHQGPVASVAFDPSGARVVTASADSKARVWAVATARSATQVAPTGGAGAAVSDEHGRGVMAAVASRDRTRLVTTTWDGTAQVWDVATGQVVASLLGHRAPVVAAEFSPDGTRVATASWDGTARVWDAVTGRALTGPLPHDRDVVAAVFSPDGGRLATASSDRTARVWDAATGKPITAPLVHQETVEAVAFSLDGARLATASMDGTAWLWDAATGKRLAGPLTHKNAVWRIAFSPGGTRVVTASHDRTARIWDAATGAPVTGPLEHLAQVMDAAFSADGTRVLTRGVDDAARVWDAATGLPVTAPMVQRAMARAAFSPDGTRVVTASRDGPILIWDATSGQPLIAAIEPPGAVELAVFSLDGARVITASVVGAVGQKRLVVRSWAIASDTGALERWRDVARCAPFVLSGAGLVANPGPFRICTVR